MKGDIIVGTEKISMLSKEYKAFKLKEHYSTSVMGQSLSVKRFSNGVMVKVSKRGSIILDMEQASSLACWLQYELSKEVMADKLNELDKLNEARKENSLWRRQAEI